MTADELIEITQCLHETWTVDEGKTITFTSRDDFVKANLEALEAAAIGAGVSAREGWGKFELIKAP